MENILVDYRNRIAILTLDRSTTNAIDAELVRELRDCLQSIRDDSSVSGIVLTSASRKFFSIGFDIPALYDLSRGEFEHFYSSFNMLCIELYAFPKPAVAAVTGHATAGGCILALCCDYRFITNGRALMGVNEIRLGVPVPYPADCMLRRLIGTGPAREVIDTGRFYDPRESKKLGLVDEVIEPEQLMERAVEYSGEIAAYPHDAFAVGKMNRTGPVMEEIEQHRREREKTFLDLWYAEPARTLLGEAIEKF